MVRRAGSPPSSSLACTREVPKSAPYAILEGQVKRFHFLALVLALAATEATAQTTVANFDSPACSGKAIGVYQGIDFTLSPWDCENPGLAGQTGTSISWYRRTFSGQFKLQTPGTLLSLSAAASTGSGTLTLSATLAWDDGTPVAGSLNLSQLTGPGSQIQLGTFAINSSGGASGTVSLDLTQPDPLTFQVVLIGTNNTTVGAPATFQVSRMMFPSNLTGISAKIVLSKATATIKSFNMGLVP